MVAMMETMMEAMMVSIMRTLSDSDHDGDHDRDHDEDHAGVHPEDNYGLGDGKSSFHDKGQEILQLHTLFKRFSSSIKYLFSGSSYFFVKDCYHFKKYDKWHYVYA
jgi:hypothetical protein